MAAEGRLAAGSANKDIEVSVGSLGPRAAGEGERGQQSGSG